jgi:hypothetical protein
MTLQIAANDHGAIYVFAVAGAASDALARKQDDALIAVFGPVVLNTDFVDVITPDMLGEMSLSQLISQGYDMDMSDAEQVLLDGLQGTIVLVMSAATGGDRMTLTLPAHVRHAATLREDPVMTSPTPLTAKSAEGTLDVTPTRSKKSDARIGGMIAMYALIGMFALVGLMIWVGG